MARNIKMEKKYENCQNDQIAQKWTKPDKKWTNLDKSGHNLSRGD